MRNIKFTRLSVLLSFILILSIIMAFAACSSIVATTPGTTATGPSASAASTPSATASGAAPGNTISIDLTAQNLAFDKSTITVKAGSQVTIDFNNKDSGIPHNFAVYTDSTAASTLFKGNNITGPATTVYTFTAPATPGTYFFRCDVHPTMMTGQFIVQ
jgi:plastocyanin